MLKKLISVTLTAALSFGALGTVGTEVFEFGANKVAASTSVLGDSLEGQRVYGREEGAYIGGTAFVQEQKAGTVIFKIKPTDKSSWNVKTKLKLKVSTLENYQSRTTPKSEIVNVDGEEYVLVYFYVSNPKSARSVFLFTNKGEYGYDPINYEAFYVEGQDLTKSGNSLIKEKKVYWEGAELRKGQVGKIDVVKPINLWKRDGNKLSFVRVLNPNESYRVYAYDTKFGGQYGLGGGYYVTKMDGFIQYKTPSKVKLVELNSN